MKEEGDWSSERRRPHGSTKFGGRSIIPDWASLPPELVEAIAHRVLSSTDGVEAYMDMRAVCSTWRSAIPKPSPLAAVGDLRFRPRQWVMVDLQSKNHGDDDARLFLHVPTGCFRRLRLLVLRDNTLVGATDGLLVLGDRKPPHLARVLNPFTGDMLHFTAPLPEHFQNFLPYTSMNGGSDSTLVLLSWGSLLCAAPASIVFTVKEFDDKYLISIVNFQGNIYCADPEGCVFKFVAPADQCDDELVAIAQVSPDVDVDTEGHDSGLRSYLVESAGELLLVRYVNHALKVFRVDVERKLLEEVKSLGGRTLFLGEERCVSLDADKLPSVDGDCIYMLDFQVVPRGMCVYNLRGDMVDIISSKNFLDQPFSLVQVLLQYCDFRS